MTDLHHVVLPHRCIVSVSGGEARAFLQGLVTNDMELVSRDRAIYAALLTPQGKYLHDFFIMGTEDGFYLDCEEQRRQDLITRLTRYRLRAQVAIRDAQPEFDIFALTGTDVSARLGLTGEQGAAAGFAGGLVYGDPRASDLGARACLPAGTGGKSLEDAGFEKAGLAPYDALRFSLGIADGAPEIEPEKSYPMEYGLDRLNGVSFSKGCYVGQEVTVRMKNRDLTRKCLVPVRIDGAPPGIGTHLNLDGANAGELRGIAGDVGLALVRKELLDRAVSDGKPFETDDARLHPTKI
ncbi:MAG: folate-binding protein [Proteobacteria bacterium]|nr:folate-binding protein [Pseudomonadota bacterium]